MDAKIIEASIERIQWDDRRFFSFLEDREMGLLGDISQEDFEAQLDEELKYSHSGVDFKAMEFVF